MSKNQINYLLLLATLAVVWLYFHTFYTGARFQKMMPQWDARRNAGAMMERPNYLPPNAIQTRYPNVRQTAPSIAEIQKVINASKSATAVAANSDAAANKQP